MTRPKTLTRQQVLNCINEWIVQHGLPPTVEELRHVLKVGSTRTVLRYLSWLEREGDIERWSGARGIRLRRLPTHRAETRALPLVGKAPAGPWMTAEENREGWIQVPKAMLSPAEGSFFLLRVRGDSMNETTIRGESIENGDLVVVRQQSTAQTGEVVVALVDGEATIKKLVIGPKYFMLKPESTNREHSPIILDADFQIQGVVTRVLKKATALLGEIETEE